MNYEEKYNNAIESIKRIYNQADSYGRELMEKEFPELRESEDERIRKELIERFNWELKGAEEQDATGCSRQKDIAMFKRGIAWLEKQSEQKSYWSEEDEEMIDFMIEFIESLCWRKDLTQRKDNVLSWLKSIKPNHWKPSEKQMEALKKRTHGLHTSSETRKALESLINDLEKL